MRGLARQSSGHPFRALRRVLFRQPSRNAELWRAIGTGFGFALIGLGILAVAVATAGVVPPATHPGDGAPVATQTMHDHGLEIYQGPAEGLPGAVPVP
jgi:hypothetical protein